MAKTILTDSLVFKYKPLVTASGTKKPHLDTVRLFSAFQRKLVEAAGIEPASASTPPLALHAYPSLFI